MKLLKTRRNRLGLSSVASVDIAGDQEWELWVIVAPLEMAARNIRLNEVQNELTENLQDLPDGSLQNNVGRYFVMRYGLLTWCCVTI